MRYNVVFVGNVGVGKTSIIQKYLNNNTAVSSTLAVDFVSLELGKFNISLWDTCGQERFFAITSSYFARAHIFILVHNIEEPSDTCLRKWHEEIVTKCPARHESVVIVVSNKTDLVPFCSDAISKWISDHDFDHVFTCANTGTGIDKLFQKIEDAITVNHFDWLVPTLPALPSCDASAVSPGCSC